jgi:hypothetical protein
MQMLTLGKKSFSASFYMPGKSLPAGDYTRYNNYVVFRNSFRHLINHQDLFAVYPSEQWDLYKYSPTFALAMMPFALLPDWLGLTAWSLLGTTLLFFAIAKFPHAGRKETALMLWFLLPEALTGTLSAQSNLLMAGLLIFAFNALEGKKTWLATLLIVITFYIKIYGAIAFLLFFLYPEKKKFFLYSIFWMIVLALLPLILITPQEYGMQLTSWLELLRSDQTVSQGLSVMGLLNRWFGWTPDKLIVIGAGFILLVLPLLKIKKYKDPLFRIFFFSSMMLWMIIFNHKAESPTFIIAVSGIAIWYFLQKPDWMLRGLLLLAFIFTCLSPTDIFPPHIRQDIFVPNLVKVIPCVIIWILLNYQLNAGKYELRKAET